jgi:hypothetical protein
MVFPDYPRHTPKNNIKRNQNIRFIMYPTPFIYDQPGNVIRVASDARALDKQPDIVGVASQHL